MENRTDEVVLEVNHLSHFIDEAKVLDDIQLTVPKGKCVALLGPNGAGKSTLIDLITGNEKPSEGTVSILGKNFKSVSNRVGVLYEYPPLFPFLKVKEIIYLIKVLHRNQSDI